MMIGNPTAEQLHHASRLVGVGLTVTEIAKRVEITLEEAIRIATERSDDWEVDEPEYVDLAE